MFSYHPSTCLDPRHLSKAAGVWLATISEMAQYQITYWQDLPSLVVARDGADLAKAPLDARFQEAIDSAAMASGAVDSDAYLAGWRRSEWMTADGTPSEVCDDVVSRLEAQWPPAALATFLSSLQAGTGTPT